MRETKLLRLLIGIGVGAFLALVAMILGWKLKFYDQVNVDIERVRTEKQTAETTANGLEEALKQEAIAKQKVKLAEAQVQYFRTRFRSLNIGDLTVEGERNATWIRYLNEYFSDYGLEVRRQIIQAADESGVVIESKISVEAPPQMPEQVVSPASGYLKPVVGGTLNTSITGTLPNVLRFFERINRAEILMTVGNVKLEGTSPTIKATFTITPYLVASGRGALLPAAASAEAPAAGGAAAEGAAGGAPPPGANAPAPPATP